MSRHGEHTLVMHLVDEKSLAFLALEGVPEEIIPTEDLRPVVAWALDYFMDSGQAPSVTALMEYHQDAIEDNEIDPAELPEDSVEWALDDLRQGWIYSTSQRWTKDFARALAEAEGSNKAQIVSDAAADLADIVTRITPAYDRTEAVPGLERRLRAYEQRASSSDEVIGLQFGLTEIDTHTGGIQDGELAVLAAPPKAGKSFMALRVALNHWRNGGKPVLFTLENPVDLTLDRLACMACVVDYQRWQQGRCGDDEITRVRTILEQLAEQETSLWVVSPAQGQRTVESLIYQARALGSDAIIIDQLTHVELPSPRSPRHERIGEALNTLHVLINSGSHKMPCLLVHQISREGQRAAKKLGRLEMYHLAESAYVERTSAWVFGLFASEAEREVGFCKFQTLASRRAKEKHWQLEMAATAGSARVYQEIRLEDVT